MRRADLALPRPWLAEPMEEGRSQSPWMVTAPGRYSERRILVASWLSEEDAKDIAAASEARADEPPPPSDGDAPPGFETVGGAA